MFVILSYIRCAQKKRFIAPSSKRQGSRLRMTIRLTCVSVFASEKESACNFSDWLVKESRIEQPDSPCGVERRCTKQYRSTY